MRAAEARRQASTITSSSIRLSFAGGQVDCTMSTSRPRTFSISSTLTSPSLKRPTNARPSCVCRLRAMSCASTGLALPANSASVSLEPILLSALRVTSAILAPCRRASGARRHETGWGGRIRTSEWRDQNPLPYHLATPQHPSARVGELAGAHLTAASGLPPVLEAFVHGRGVQALSHEAHPAIGNPRRQALGGAGAPACAEDARPVARQARRRKPRQPLERLRHLRYARAHDRLAVVAPTGLKKGAYCDE